MPISVEWSLEAFGCVAASGVSESAYCLCRHTASAARSANKEQLVTLADASRVEQCLQSLTETRIDPVVRKRLPLHHHNALSDLRKIRKPDKGPFRSCPHIDQNRTSVTFEALPDRNDGNILHVTLFTRPHCYPPYMRTSYRTAMAPGFPETSQQRTTTTKHPSSNSEEQLKRRSF